MTDKLEKIRINLAPLFFQQHELEKRVEGFREGLAKTQQELAEYNARLRTQLCERLEKGETTGSLLQDEVIRLFGLSKTAADRILGWNDRLMKSAGTELLIAISYATRFRFGGTVSPEDYITSYGHMLGILSGAALELARGENDEILLTIPFARYVQSGFGDSLRETSVKPHEGALVLKRSFVQPDALSILRHIAFADAPRDSATFMEIPSEYEAKNIGAWLGEEITEEAIAKAGMRVGLNASRSCLRKSTREERLRGENI